MVNWNTLLLGWHWHTIDRITERVNVGFGFSIVNNCEALID